MKLAGRDATRFFTRPDATLAGVLIFGADAMRVALKREDLIAALVGPDGAAEMRLTRMAGADLRRDPAALIDAIRAQGFFPGPRVAFVDEAGEGLAPTIAAALSDWRDGDAMIVVTAGALNARSALRKTFEANARAVAIGIYDDPASRDEIEAEMTRAGLAPADDAAMADLMALGQMLDPGDFRQTLEKLSLYKLGDPTPLSPEDIAACAPATTETATDAAIDLVAEGAVNRLGDLMQKIAAQGTSPTTLCIAAMRHFRLLHAAAVNPGGPEAALSRARPPVFGPRRDRLLRQVRGWSPAQLEAALHGIMETDLMLRSPRPVPAMALVERLFIRIAMQRAR